MDHECDVAKALVEIPTNILPPLHLYLRSTELLEFSNRQIRGDKKKFGMWRWGRGSTLEKLDSKQLASLSFFLTFHPIELYLQKSLSISQHIQNQLK